MNVLVIHNRYRESGGEDRVVDLESALLARHGHTVVKYIEDNAHIADMPAPVVALRTIWSQKSFGDVRRLIAQERIDVVHVHNTLALASPAVYYAARGAGTPVVQTLHNYRLLCPNGLCFRGSSPCEECVTRRAATPALRHACYRGSRAATAAVAAMLFVHNTARTWERNVDRFIAPSQFARAMFVRSGVSANRIVVKPHFVDPDPGIGTGRGGYAIFVGRLSTEKGVEVLLNAWRQLRGRVPLVIVGDGPLAPDVAAAASQIDGVRWLGRQPRSEVQRLIAAAACLVFPSLAYETFGQVIGEAYAAGTPVIASSRGAAAELVEHRRTGLVARPGDAQDVAAQVECLLSCPERLTAMRAAARRVYESQLTADANLRQLTAIYASVGARSKQIALPA